MSEVDQNLPIKQPALVDRVRGIILKPKEEWPAIEAEPSSIADIYRGYVLPLSAIPPVASLIGSLIFGYSFLGVTYRPSAGAAVTGAIVQYALGLVGVYLLALLIDALAPNFGATKNRVQAFKVAAYSATASWVAGIFGLFPPLAVLTIVGIYSLYLLYLGLPRLMKSPQDKALPYTAVVIIVAIVLAMVAAALAGRLTASFAPYNPGIDGTLSGMVAMPGGGSVDLDKVQAATRQLEANAKRMEAAAAAGTAASAAGASIAPDVLQNLLPAALPGGFARSEVSSSSAGAAGMGGSQAEARYKNGAAEVSLQVTDLAAAGALAAIGSAFNVQSNKQTATGYEKVGKVAGRMTTEKWDSAARNGSYGVMVADRFMIQADGNNGAAIDTLKSAVAAIDPAALEKLAKQ